MVTDEERDYMYAEYAKDPRMQLNLGIRRRLAPLLDNGRDEIELLHAILFSLPGTPVLYYGDEIGMGDNVYLGDRDGVRTPMQWTGDRNGGFSRADFAQLYLPPLMDPVYGYQAVNVEAQLRTPTSLLRWLHRFIALRKEHPVFGLGTLRAARARQPADLRARPPLRGGHRALRPQPRPLGAAVELDLVRSSTGWSRRRCSAARASRAIGELPYLLTLAPRGFFWFQLRRRSERDARSLDRGRRSIEYVDAAALVRREVARASRARSVLDSSRCARPDAAARARARRGALRARARTTSTSCRRRAGTASRARRRSRDDRRSARELVERDALAALDACTAREGAVEFQRGRAASPGSAASSARRARSATRAVEHVGRRSTTS